MACSNKCAGKVSGDLELRIINPEIEKIKPLFSLRRIAEFFDCYTADGRPATDTVLDWMHRGKIPPPDMRISRKAIYWKPSTIYGFVENGGSE